MRAAKHMPPPPTHRVVYVEQTDGSFNYQLEKRVSGVWVYLESSKYRGNMVEKGRELVGISRRTVWQG